MLQANVHSCYEFPQQFLSLIVSPSGHSQELPFVCSLDMTLWSLPELCPSGCELIHLALAWEPQNTPSMDTHKGPSPGPVPISVFTLPWPPCVGPCCL